MLPNNALSSQPVISEFLTQWRDNPLIDFELGGIALQDSAAGLNQILWTCSYEDGFIKLSHDQHEQTVLNVENVTALSLGFDLSMRPVIAYLVDEHCYLWWYDTSVSKQIITDLGSGITFPQLSLDERRSVQSSNADVILTYIRNSKMYMRLQRERFQIEHEITRAKRLIQTGSMKNNRFGFAYYNWD
ncbi:hypothetical protein [Acinetobacter pragensis]|uniref:Uncharacterized protein n=1 Tax=Acinetobacter pragensis TaxID=1806892 RepID=A0A151Y214_9GAMM|nr:hypothetical protein [Acinetobacter pragensis]KYQ72040.1 hypothetical protein AZH43_12555 [Acinetobacter pragensis]